MTFGESENFRHRLCYQDLKAYDLYNTPKMAPNRGPPTKSSGKRFSSRKSSLPAKSSKSSKPSNVGTKGRVTRKPPTKQQKTKSSTASAKKKRRIYTEKELDLPTLNMITPVGVAKPKGKKRGKVFVDDAVSLAIFNDPEAAQRAPLDVVEFCGRD